MHPTYSNLSDLKNFLPLMKWFGDVNQPRTGVGYHNVFAERGSAGAAWVPSACWPQLGCTCLCSLVRLYPIEMLRWEVLVVVFQD